MTAKSLRRRPQPVERRDERDDGKSYDQHDDSDLGQEVTLAAFGSKPGSARGGATEPAVRRSVGQLGADFGVANHPLAQEQKGDANRQDDDQRQHAEADSTVPTHGRRLSEAVEIESRVISAPPPSTANRIALYLRVSTEEQDLAGQERELREEAARRGWEVVAVFAEKVSGTGKVERTEYDRLIAQAANPDRPWTHLLVWSLDRFSRAETFTKATQAVLDLEGLGVRFHSLKEPQLDTPEDGVATVGRDVLLAILPVVATFESKRRSERVRVAMRELKEGRRKTRSGKPVGRPRRVTPELTRRILELRGRGLLWREVAVQVKLPAGTCAATASRQQKASKTPPRD